MVSIKYKHINYEKSLHCEFINQQIIHGGNYFCARTGGGLFVLGGGLAKKLRSREYKVIYSILYHMVSTKIAAYPNVKSISEEKESGWGNLVGHHSFDTEYNLLFHEINFILSGIILAYFIANIGSYSQLKIVSFFPIIMKKFPIEIYKRKKIEYKNLKSLKS